MGNSRRLLSGTHKPRFKQHGAQLIELALILPAILTVVFAIVGYSLMFMVQHTLSSAVSQAARSVAVAGSTANPEAAARQLLLEALPSALYPEGFSFNPPSLTNLSKCGANLDPTDNPALSCLEFSGAFTIKQNPFMFNIPFSNTFFPEQLSASAVVLYQNTDAL